MASDKYQISGRRMIVRDKELREHRAVDIVRRYYGRLYPGDDVPIPHRVGPLRNSLIVVLKKLGVWFAVKRRDVQQARLRAFRVGVTFASYAEFDLLRRNYEADPDVFGRGLRTTAHSDARPCISPSMKQIWMGSRISLIEFMDELDRNQPEPGTAALRVVIRSILDDMSRPLKPRGRRRQRVRL